MINPKQSSSAHNPKKLLFLSAIAFGLKNNRLSSRIRLTEERKFKPHLWLSQRLDPANALYLPLEVQFKTDWMIGLFGDISKLGR